MLWLLPNRPEETPFLTEEERKIQTERMNRGLKADVGRTINKAHIAAAFKDWRVSWPQPGSRRVLTFSRFTWPVSSISEPTARSLRCPPSCPLSSRRLDSVSVPLTHF